MRKIRYGIIGAGDIAQKNHLPSFESFPEVELIALSDINKERLEKVSKEFDIPLAFTDYKKMLSDVHLDAVSICTPNFLHSTQTIDCLNASCHVLCEKPMAINLEEAEMMVRIAEEKNKNLMIPFRFQFSPEAQTLKKLINKGELGIIYYAKSGWIRGETIFKEKDSWFTKKEKSGGGCLIDIGVYMINVALWLMGNPEASSVSASTYQKLQTYDVKVEDLALAFIKLKNGATLSIETSWALNIDPKIYVSLCGEKGGADLYPLKIYKREEGKVIIVMPEITKEDNFRLIAKEFISSIKEERKAEGNGEQGLKVMKIIEAIYLSARKGKEIYF